EFYSKGGCRSNRLDFIAEMPSGTNESYTTLKYLGFPCKTGRRAMELGEFWPFLEVSGGCRHAESAWRGGRNQSSTLPQLPGEDFSFRGGETGLERKDFSPGAGNAPLKSLDNSPVATAPDGTRKPADRPIESMR